VIKARNTAVTDFNVLLIEDTLEIAQMVMETLRYIPEIETHHIANGNDAVDYLDSNRPDLVLLDLNIPGRSGWKVMEFLNEKYSRGTVKVIVMTAQSDGANKLVGKLQDVERYLVKPVPPREMISTIREILNIESS
jgi:two-component system, OmpR family, response regulator BaeR